MERRDLLLGLSAAAGGLWLNAAGAAQARRNVLVVIFQRGAVDGLNMVVPHASDDYYRLRPTVHVPSPGEPDGALDLDGYFGLHPSLEPLLGHWQAGRMAAVHAIGSPHETRSHFKAQDIMEKGVQSEKATLAGWAGRHIAATSRGGADSPFRAVGIAHSPPLSLAGPIPPLALQNFDVFDALTDQGADFLAAVSALHESYTPLDRQGRMTLSALSALEAANPAAIEPQNDARYPETAFARSLRKTAQLIHADLGAEIIALDVGGWDTHADQNNRLRNRLRELAGGLDAFLTDLGPALARVTVVTMSEFGRRGHENGSGGTDHGHGGAMLAFGGGVNGGRVYGQWPGLAAEDLDRGDLQITTDYRAVLSEMLRSRHPDTDLTRVFPGYSPSPALGLFTA